MTKADLLRALEPFTDETEAMIGDSDRWFEVEPRYGYAQRFNGNGCLVLNLGAKILLKVPTR